MVVATQDAILVASQDNAAGMKDLIARLKQVAPDVTEDHLRVHRPWGAYQSLDISERHQVKRITVKAGGRLSLQKHKFRSEHWIVVRGVARVTIDDTVKTVNENESVYIPLGAVHRLEESGPGLAGTDRGPDRNLFRRGATSSALRTIIAVLKRGSAGPAALAACVPGA